MAEPHTQDELVHAPHAPLTRYYSSEGERKGWLGSIFDSTAPDYDRIERVLGLGTGPWYRGQALQRAGLANGMRVADIGVGTGLVATQAAILAGDPSLITGVDPSAGMMENAKVPAGVTLLQGRAEEIPLPDASVDFLSMGYALRHISDLHAAFREFHRVLKPGGRFCILEITCPEKPMSKFLLKLYLRNIVPGLAALASRSTRTSELWRYYWDSIEACAKPASVMKTLEAVGFEAVDRHVELGVFSEYTGRRSS